MAKHDWTGIMAAITNLINEIEAFADPVIGPELSKIRAAVPRVDNPTARDWAGFFAALAAFMSQIMPLIIPLFMNPQTKS
jgi:hypothetical protein